MNKLLIENLPELPYATLEAVNRLRINISFLGKDIRKIMLISTMPNEGKSFVAMQLWHQMAETGTTTMFLDADLRKSVMTEKYQIKGEQEKKIRGTSHCLANDYPFEEAIYHTKWENADILPNVDNVINPSMLIESARFEELLEYTAEKYRYVFVDSPPLSLVSDGERIGNLCDGAILVVRGAVTSKNAVKNSIRQLQRAGCPLLGIVLNRVGGARGGYYYKRYGGRKYYYGSHHYYGSKYYTSKYYTDKYYYKK